MHHRSWTTRPARPAAAAAAAASSPQEQENPQPRLRRKTSFTQRLLGCKSVTAEPLPTVEEKARPRTFYVPTHAAASFARTVSPRSPIRIEERDEHEDEDEHGSGSSGRKKCNTTTTTTAAAASISNSNYTHSRSPKAASYYQADTAAASPPPRTDAPSTDYAAFLAQAEVNERAARARMAPPRRQESGRAWCQSNGSTAVGGTAALRDSAYHSTGSRSSSRGRGRGRGLGVGEDTVAPLPARRQPRTLGRRLSEYFKPPRREGCLGEMG